VSKSLYSIYTSLYIFLYIFNFLNFYFVLLLAFYLCSLCLIIMNKFLSYGLGTFFDFSTICHYKNVFNLYIYIYLCKGIDWFHPPPPPPPYQKRKQRNCLARQYFLFNKVWGWVEGHLQCKFFIIL
jgi:hypothetical protein